MAHVILLGPGTRTTFADGPKNVAVIKALLESSESGDRITLQQSNAHHAPRG